MYIYTYTYNGVLFNHKKEGILHFARTWMDTEGIRPSEIQMKRNIYSHFMWNLRKKKKAKPIKMENRMVFPGNGGREGTVSGWSKL